MSKIALIAIAIFVLINLVISIDYSNQHLDIENIDSSELSEVNLRRAVSALSLVSSSDSDSASASSSSNDFTVDLLSSPSSPKKDAAHCEPITVPMCQNLEYNMTSMPNQFEHASQSEAAADAHQFWALVEFNCARELKFFLCSMYTPICIPGYTQPIKACRSVCIRARLGCERYMKKFGFDWPDHMRCELFPEYGSGEVCMDPMDAEEQRKPGNAKKQFSSRKNSRIHDYDNSIIPTSSISLSQDDLIRLDLTGPRENQNFARCPSPFVLVDRDIATNDMRNCAQPCKSIYFDDWEQKFMNYWLLVWSILCMLSSICTTSTFLIEPSRFKYPEKPIIYLSICYLFVSLGYLMKFVFGHEKMACETDGSIRSFESSSSSSSAWPCLISFTLIYYFTMASSVWWCVMSLTWFLAAGMKWCAESIARYRAHFHFIAWSLPFVQTLVILTHSYVEADSLTGLCAANSAYLSLLPATVYLIVGIVFLVAGFVALLKVRRSFSRRRHFRRACDNHKLDKLMIRIGVFSVLFTVPATCVIASNYYESVYRTDWEKTVICRRMSLDSSSICSGRFKEQKPEFWVFVLKYFMSLVIGVTSGFWIWNSKSWYSWKIFLNKMCFSSESMSKLTPNSSECTTDQTPLCCLLIADLFHCNKKIRRKDSVVYFQANDDPMCNKPATNFYDLPHQQPYSSSSDDFAPVLIKQMTTAAIGSSTSCSTGSNQLYQQQPQPPHLITLGHAPFYEYPGYQIRGGVNSTNSTHSTSSTVRK